MHNRLSWFYKGDSNTPVPMQVMLEQLAHGITFWIIPSGFNGLGLQHVFPAHSWWKETDALHKQVMRISRPLKLLCWIHKLFVVIRPRSLSCSTPVPLSLHGAYVHSFSSLLWDLRRTDSNNFLLDALRIHCMFRTSQRDSRQSRKFETFIGVVAFGYKILMSFLLLFSLALYDRRWQA